MNPLLSMRSVPGARGLGLIVVVTVLGGCPFVMTAQDDGVPAWARHVRASVVNINFGVERTAARLSWELNQPKLVDDHLAPEQIALLAVSEIEKGRTVDAALWLAIASYRYHEETMHAATVGVDGQRNLPAGVRVDKYMDLVKEEVRRYSRLGFVDELDVLRDRLGGLNATELAMQQQLAELGKAGALDREALHDALSEWQPQKKGPTNLPRYPALVDAFRRRLLHDFEWNQQDGFPGFYLGRTPVPSLQKDALLAVLSLFEPAICAGVADTLPNNVPKSSPS